MDQNFITNGQHADFVVTVAKTNPNVKGPLVFHCFGGHVFEGFSRGRNLSGLHSPDTELFFDEVGPDQILEVIKGSFDDRTSTCLALAMSAVAAMEYMMDITKNMSQKEGLW